MCWGPGLGGGWGGGGNVRYVRALNLNLFFSTFPPSLNLQLNTALKSSYFPFLQGSAGCAGVDGLLNRALWGNVEDVPADRSNYC